MGTNTRTSQDLDFFYFIGSTYTYLSVMRIEEVAAKENIKVRWRPFSVRTIMIKQNNSPFSGKPVKAQYMWRDIERRAASHNIPFKSIPAYPVDPKELANRVAIIAAEEGWVSSYTKAVYEDWFLENNMPGDVTRLRLILKKLSKDPDVILARADTPEIQEKFAAETVIAENLGIFGSPTFVSGNEIFWGDDRLEDAIRWVKRAGT